MPESLSTWLSARSLVNVHRKGVDEHAMQGFLVGLSEELLAIEFVFDFQIDGLTILRRSDVSKVERSDTDAFQERLLEREGVRPGSFEPAPLELNDWGQVIRQLASRWPLMILERELGPEPGFAIGRVLSATAAQVQFQNFSGTGEWYRKIERLKYSQITRVQVNTRYLGFYQRYFDGLEEASR